MGFIPTLPYRKQKGDIQNIPVRGFTNEQPRWWNILDVPFLLAAVTEGGRKYGVAGATPSRLSQRWRGGGRIEDIPRHAQSSAEGVFDVAEDQAVDGVGLVAGEAGEALDGAVDAGEAQ